MPFRHRSFQFVASDVNGLPQSRKKTQRACTNCRKRKRRCTHGIGTSQRLQVSGDTQTRSTLSPPVNGAEEPTNSPDSSQGNEHQNAQAPSQAECIDGESWFVGDLDPEGAFLVAASPSSSSRSTRRHGDVGVWLSARNAYSQLAVKKPRSSLMSCLDPLLSSVFLPYLEHQCLGALPAPSDMKELLKIYLENIQPMFPVLDYESYQVMSDTSPEKILLSQSICIAASIDQSAKEFLRLPTVSSSDCDFSRNLLDAMNTSIALGLVRDKFVLIQAMSLASLFTQFSGNRQESAELLSRAICHTYTLGIHHHCPSSIQRERISTRIFCCLYALDVLTAAFLGRPMQFHRRDTNRDMNSCIAAQDSCFQLFLHTIHLMERVIELYQPVVNSTWKEEFPSFEDLLQQVDSSDISLHFIATIEVLYHAAAILSCRSASPDGVSPTSDSKLRQSFSASRVTSIVGEEFHNELCLFPIVPYAVALSLRVSYQTLQQSKAQLFQARARKQLVSNCQILRELGKTFYSASLMADLGEYLIDRRDGVPEGNDGPSLLARMNKDHPLSENSTMHNNQQAETEPFQPPYQSFETGFFDSMSTLGIFDNFDLDSGIFGSMNQ